MELGKSIRYSVDNCVDNIRRETWFVLDNSAHFCEFSGLFNDQVFLSVVNPTITSLEFINFPILKKFFYEKTN